MAIHEPVLDYQVAVLHNDVVDYDRVIRITTTTGATVFLAFPSNPPDDWLQFSGANATVYLPASDFDAMYRLLREESPLFVTTLNLLGIRAFTLDTGTESPGQAASDPAELRELYTRS